MAEGDRFERAFRAVWRGAYQLARNDAAPPAEVGDKLVTALAKTLRERGGVPGFGEMVGTRCGGYRFSPAAHGKKLPP